MKWINPREELPNKNELVWILIIENREGYRCGMPSAKCLIAECHEDKYGILFAQEIGHKGYPAYSYYFYQWKHYYPEDNCRFDEMITAWAPYNGLPTWENINSSESKEIILKKDSYHKQLTIEKNIKNENYFIRLEEAKPKNGVYVVATANGVFLSRYDSKLCDPWIAPNGEDIIAWYPIPTHYS